MSLRYEGKPISNLPVTVEGCVGLLPTWDLGFDFIVRDSVICNGVTDVDCGLGAGVAAAVQFAVSGGEGPV